MEGIGWQEWKVRVGWEGAVPTALTHGQVLRTAKLHCKTLKLVNISAAEFCIFAARQMFMVKVFGVGGDESRVKMR